MFPENREVKPDEISPYTKALIEKVGTGTVNSVLNSPKLIADLMDKKSYICHWKNLEVGLRAGYRIKRVHKIIRFTQKAFCKPYIDVCIKARSQAKNEFEKNFFKLAQNAL